MKKIFVYLFVLLTFNTFSQEMVIDWDECFGGENEWSVAKAIDVLSNGSIVTSITINSDNEAYTNYHGDTDPWVLIMDSAGNIIQERCFGGSGEEVFQDIEVFDDYIYFIGYTQSTDGDVQSEPIGGYVDLWVVKTDYNLNIIWENRYGSLGVQELRTAKVTEEGGLVMLMDFFSSGGGDVSEYYGNTDIWVCELDSDGNILWEKTLGNAWGSYAGSVMLTDDGKTIVLGETDHSGDMVDCYCQSTDGSRDIWAVGLNETGEILWQNCYGGTNWEVGYDILSENQGYTFIGLTRSTDGDVSNNHGEDDLWLVHIDSIGNLVWEKSFGGSKVDYGKELFKTQNNGYILMGSSESNDGDVNHTHCFPSNICSNNTWIIELDSNRNMIWNKTYGSATWESYHTYNSVARIGEKDFIIADIIRDSDNHSGDIDCEPYPINNGHSAWIYRLYDPTMGSNTIERNYNNLDVYPNPASNHVYIELPQNQKETEIQVHDIFGKKIESLRVFPNQKQVLWDVRNIQSGVYFYQTEINGEVYRGKIIVN